MDGLTETQTAVLEQIKSHRRGDEVTGGMISALIGLIDKRETPGANLRAVVNALRRKGYPVLANGKGYFWPSGRADIEQYKDSLVGRIKKQQQALEGIIKSLDDWAVQNNLTGPKLGYSSCHNAPTFGGGYCTVCRQKNEIHPAKIESGNPR